MTSFEQPKTCGLYRSDYEHDACGVEFINCSEAVHNHLNKEQGLTAQSFKYSSIFICFITDPEFSVWLSEIEVILNHLTGTILALGTLLSIIIFTFWSLKKLVQTLFKDAA